MLARSTNRVAMHILLTHHFQRQSRPYGAQSQPELVLNNSISFRARIRDKARLTDVVKVSGITGRVGVCE